MAPLLKELTELEVEPLEVVVNVHEQDGSLETLITPHGEVNAVAVLTLDGIFSANSSCPPLTTGTQCCACTS